MESNISGAGIAGNGTGIAGGKTTSTINAALPAATASPGGAGRPAKVSTGFMTRDTDAQFVVDTARIIAGMTGNTAFPTPMPALADVIAARNAYTAAVTAGQDSRLGRSQRTKTRQALVALLRPLAHYVEDTCVGDRTLLIGSGFPLQQSRAPVGSLAAPAQVRLVKGKTSGTAIARCQRNAQARGYHWRLAPAATPTVFSPVVTTFSAHVEFDSLASMTVYIVQARAVGTAGTGDWSETAAALVL
jgi:hypothetical protein